MHASVAGIATIVSISHAGVNNALATAERDPTR